MRLARQEKNVEAGQVTEYVGITYATIKVRTCAREQHSLSLHAFIKLGLLECAAL